VGEGTSVSDEFVIGPGVRQAMDDAGDFARSDEQFIILLDGDKVSQTFSNNAIYYWLERDNSVKRSSF
jgi:hypothetical protein